MVYDPSEIVEAAEKARMPVPPNPDRFDEEIFPHFHVFCVLQLGRTVNHINECYTNAKVIAQVPSEKIKEISLHELTKMGLSFY